MSESLGKKELSKEIIRQSRIREMEEEERNLPAFESVQVTIGLKRSLNYLKSNGSISYQWSFGRRNCVAFIKRVLRKIFKRVISPIKQQNMINLHIVSCLDVIQYLHEENQMLKKEIEEIREELREQETVLHEMRNRDLSCE